MPSAIIRVLSRLDGLNVGHAATEIMTGREIMGVVDFL
jgi:hypothetical protein